MTLGAVVLGIFVFAFTLRALPRWLSPHGVGVDHWYWKAYIEEYRAQRVFPPRLPQYVLDDKHWYPPLFPLLLATLPANLFDRWSGTIAMLVDLARLALLLGVVAWQTDGRVTVLLVAGLIYATTPIQISYNIQLNPRCLGAIFLDCLLVTLLWLGFQGGPVWAWVLATLLGALVLLTHKMTTQVMVFILVGTAVIYSWWALFALLPACFLAAIILSRGFYWKVLLAHLDILAFWHRNWRWLGADQLRESPLYGDSGYERREKLHKKGIRGLLWHGFILAGFNPAAWIACFLVYERLMVPSPLLIYPTPFLVWLVLPCLFAILTSVVPVLRFLGAGYLYMYNATLMASLVLGLTYEYTRAPAFSATFVGLALLLNLLGFVAFLRQLMRSDRTRLSPELESLVLHLRERPPGLVMCMPLNWSEVVSYKAGKPVLWGGHGYGFTKIEPIFPRLLRPIQEVVKTYGVRYFLTHEAALVDRFVADLPRASVQRIGSYRLYDFGSPDGG